MRFLDGFLAVGFAALLSCAACSANPTASQPTLMSGEDLSHGRRGTTEIFHLNDRIIQVVDFTWADPKQDGGLHSCEWKWYRDGKLVSDTPERRFDFSRTPYTLHTMRPAAAAGDRSLYRRYHHRRHGRRDERVQHYRLNPLRNGGKHSPEGLAAEQVDMEMRHFLSAMRAHVREQPVAWRIETEIGGHLSDRAEEAGDFRI